MATNKEILNLLNDLKTDMDGRFEKIDSRFEKIDSRFEKIENNMVTKSDLFSAVFSVHGMSLAIIVGTVVVLNSLNAFGG